MSEPLVVDLAEAADGRYARQELVSWWQQERLAAARVLVVGAGALGNELVKNLTLLGVGHVVVVDFDTVELSNLARGVMMRESDVGRPKAEVVAERAMELDPAVSVEAVVGSVEARFGVGEIARFDVVLGGLDSREARLQTNELCWKATVPFVDGAIDGLIGIARCFAPPSSACYECTLGEADLKLLSVRRSCALLAPDDLDGGRVPTTATTASVVAAMQVQEAVKIIHDAPGADALVGKGFVFNGMTHDSYVVTYQRDEECLSHDTYDLSESPVVERTATLGDLLKLAEAEVGPGAHVQLEHEIVTGFACAGCERDEARLGPAFAMSHEDSACPECGEPREVRLVHRVERGGPLDLDLPLAELALPRGDVLSAVAGSEKVRMVLGNELESEAS